MHGLGHRNLFHGVVSLALIGGLAAGGDGGLLGGLLGLLGGGSGTTTSATVKPGGRLHMDSQKLRKGCQRYSYQYALTVPSGDDFDLEIFVSDPRGVSQASDVILSGADALSGTKSLTICRSNTTPGTFTMRGTLYTNDGSGPTTTTPLPNDTFTLTYHKKHHHKHRHGHHHKHHHKNKKRRH